MTDCYEIENNAIDGEDEMGSLTHGTVQNNLGGLLKFKCDKELAVIIQYLRQCQNLLFRE